MDINQLEWDVVWKKHTLLKATLLRLPVIIPITAAFLFGATKVAYQQPYMKPIEVAFFLDGFVIVAMLTVVMIWHQIYLSLPPKLIHGKMMEMGLTVGRRKISLSDLKSSNLDDFLRNHAIPYGEWHQPRPDSGEPIELVLPTIRGKIKLMFAEEYIRQKFIRTLQDYLHPVEETVK